MATGRPHQPGKQVVLTVGSDCAIGKMTVSVELRKAAVQAGLDAVMVPTGQTGIMIEGWGVAVDRLISDFVAGTVEWLVAQAEEMGDFIIVEGQGSIDHPSYSGVTLGLLHGSAPHAMVMVHEPGRVLHHGWEDRADQPNAHLKSIAGADRDLRVAGRAGGTRQGDGHRAQHVRDERAGRARRDRPGAGGDRHRHRRPGALRRLSGWSTASATDWQGPAHEPGHPQPRRSRCRSGDPFRIARAEDFRTATTVVVDVALSGGLEGVGEAFPVAYYGETVGTVGAVLPLLAEVVEALGDPPSGVEAARTWLAARGRRDGGAHRWPRLGQGRPGHRAP